MNEKFCLVCQRITYVAEGAELYCPVCSSPLVEISDASDSEAI